MHPVQCPDINAEMWLLRFLGLQIRTLRDTVREHVHMLISDHVFSPIGTLRQYASVSTIVLSKEIRLLQLSKHTQYNAQRRYEQPQDTQSNMAQVVSRFEVSGTVEYQQSSHRGDEVQCGHGRDH